MRESYFFYWENNKNQSNDKCNNISSCSDKMNSKKTNCCEKKDNYQKNNCYDNTKKCFYYQYLLGATGPTGPSAGLSAYGGRFNNTTQTITLGIGTQTPIPLANTMPNRGVTYTTANSINIQSAGSYEINYYSNILATVATTLTLAVRVNGTSIPSATISRALYVGTWSIYSGSVIVTLAPGDVIDMAVSATLALGVTLGTGVNVTLSAKRLN